MNLESLFNNLLATCQQYPIPAVGVLLVLAVFLWKKPGEFLKFALIFGVIGIALYLGSQLGESGESGTSGKHTLTTQTEEAMEK